MSDRPKQIIWAPQPGPQKALVDCPLPVIFYGGARGGGKTDGVLGKWALKEQMYGRAFNAIMFRRTTVSADDAIERSKEIYQPLGGKFSESKLIWRMPRGGRVSFKYLETVSDANEYQGRNLTDAWVEEVGQYALPDPVDRLNAVLRSTRGVPTQLLLTGNPGGAGQHWIRNRFELHPLPKSPKIVPMTLPNGNTVKMAVIPSRLGDNQILMREDPGYVDRLYMSGGAKLVQAWLDGDWSAIEGAYFEEWGPQHEIQPFAVPDHWLRFTSFDWGSAKPFCHGWYAVAGEDFTTPDGTFIPKGALVKYREWYGAKSPNVGVKMPTEDVAAGILEREDEPIDYRVADPSIFAEDGGPSRAERFGDCGVYFTEADNKRVARQGAVGGWDMFRYRLKGAKHPMIFFFTTCSDSIRTIPVLQHDEERPEDLDTDMEDHPADETRYACMSRPWIPAPKVEPQPDLDAWGRPRQTDNWKTL